MNGEKSEKTRLRWLRAILSWVSRPISWLYHTLMDWRVWKDWPWWVKVIAVIWMLLPFPHLYEILKIWLPWIHTLLDEIGIRLPELSQPELSQPELSQPELSQPELSQPELSQPELSQPELSQPELSQPELSQPELSQPELSQPELSQPELSQPELSQPELSQPELSQEEQNQSLFDQVRTSMLVIAAWYGVFFLIWRTVLADRQTRSTEMQTHSVEMQTQINRENHYTDLFTKAVEQLGATRPDGLPAIEIRIGAIFALERLAKDSERDYGPIIEILAAYIREHCRDPKPFNDDGLIGEEFNQAWQEWIESLRENPPADRSDIAAVLTVLSRRKQNRHWTSTSEDETQPDFTGANFQGAMLWNKSEGLGCDGTNLRLAHLEGANLFGADLSGANLSLSNLSGANLFGADLSGANLSDAKLMKSNLIKSKIVNIILIGADLSGANLFGANLSGADLWRANLSGADLWRANLLDAHLGEADLSGAYLFGADLSGTDLSEASLSHALLAGAHLRDSNGLTTEMIENAYGDENTSLPNGVTRPAPWGSQQEAIEKWQAFCESQGFTVSL